MFARYENKHKDFWIPWRKMFSRSGKFNKRKKEGDKSR
jgi:hypothetical protein